MRKTINDFVDTVEAVNNGELTPEEMHETYANAQSYLDCVTLSRLEYFAERVQEVIAIAHRNRAAQYPMKELNIKVASATLQAVLGGVTCPRMARAWRNRSPVTQCDWARHCLELFDNITLDELPVKAAAVYAACSYYAERAGNSEFDGGTVPPRDWELIVTLTDDFLSVPPDRALGRPAWEARHKSAKQI